MADIIVGAFVVGILAAAINNIRKKGKSGGGCGCGCSSCNSGKTSCDR